MSNRINVNGLQKLMVFKFALLLLLCNNSSSSPIKNTYANGRINNNIAREMPEETGPIIGLSNSEIQVKQADNKGNEENLGVLQAEDNHNTQNEETQDYWQGHYFYKTELNGEHNLEIPHEGEQNYQAENDSEQNLEIQPEEEQNLEIQPEYDQNLEIQPEEEQNLEIQPEYDQNLEIQPEEEQNLEIQPEEEQNLEIQPEEEQNLEIQPEEEQNLEIQPEYDQNLEIQPEEEQNLEIQPEYDQNLEIQPEEEQNLEIQPEYEQNLEIKPEYEQNLEIQPEEEQNLEIKPEYEQNLEIQPEYDQNLEIQPEEEQNLEIQPEYDQNLEIQPEEEQNLEIQPEYEQNLEIKPEYEQNLEIQPEEEQNLEIKPEYEQSLDILPDGEVNYEPGNNDNGLFENEFNENGPFDNFVGTSDKFALPAKVAVEDDFDALSYLKDFGYINDNDYNGNEMAEESDGYGSANALKAAVQKFQENYQSFGLTPNGVLDSKTRQLMETPRCGSTDKVDANKMDSPIGKWTKRDLTYRIRNSTSKVPRTEVREEFRKAFDEWQNVTSLRFTEVKYWQPSDITIRFDYGGCVLGKFSATSKALAHAAFPNDVNGYLGQIHFDEARIWTLSGYSGTNLFQVAVHEIGHALGLPHSQYKGSIMKPFYQYADYFHLHKDDIAEIQYLYPMNQSIPISVPSPTKITPRIITDPVPTPTVNNCKTPMNGNCYQIIYGRCRIIGKPINNKCPPLHPISTGATTGTPQIRSTPPTITNPVPLSVSNCKTPMNNKCYQIINGTCQNVKPTNNKCPPLINCITPFKNTCYQIINYKCQKVNPVNGKCPPLHPISTGATIGTPQIRSTPPTITNPVPPSVSNCKTPMNNKCYQIINGTTCQNVKPTNNKCPPLINCITPFKNTCYQIINYRCQKVNPVNNKCPPLFFNITKPNQMPNRNGIHVAELHALNEEYVYGGSTNYQAIDNQIAQNDEFGDQNGNNQVADDYVNWNFIYDQSENNLVADGDVYEPPTNDQYVNSYDENDNVYEQTDNNRENITHKGQSGVSKLSKSQVGNNEISNYDSLDTDFVYITTEDNEETINGLNLNSHNEQTANNEVSTGEYAEYNGQQEGKDEGNVDDDMYPFANFQDPDGASKMTNEGPYQSVHYGHYQNNGAFGSNGGQNRWLYGRN